MDQVVVAVQVVVGGDRPVGKVTQPAQELRVLAHRDVFPAVLLQLLGAASRAGYV